MQNKWILCKKWFLPKLKPMVLTEEQKKGDKPPEIKPEYDYLPRWIPVGISAGVPMWWDTQEEVIDVLKALVCDRPELQKTLFVACQMKYVPNKVKSYKKEWFDKYVKKEVNLKIEKQKDQGEALFTDESKININ